LKLGVALGRARPGRHLEIALEAERLGFESVWMPEHLIFPVDLAGSPHPGASEPPVPANTPVFDAFGWLAFLAGRTSRIRLGTDVYLLGLRHPFVAARAVQTLDVVSEGRAEVGIGAGWLRAEWRAAGLDPSRRGRRLDEALMVCKRLWSEPVIEHHGEFFDFPPVVFEPKPVQRPWPPLHAGGESDAALCRAARDCDGWLALGHTPESVAQPMARLAELRKRFEREDAPFQVSVHAGFLDREALRRLAEAGVARVLVAPWERSAQALDGLRRQAEVAFGSGELARW
jgi:probable F420-dependent oxidoreductase